MACSAVGLNRRVRRGRWRIGRRPRSILATTRLPEHPPARQQAAYDTRPSEVGLEVVLSSDMFQERRVDEWAIRGVKRTVNPEEDEDLHHRQKQQ